MLEEEEDELYIMEDFSTKKCYNILMGDLEPCQFEIHVWKRGIRNRVSFMLWAAFHHSLLTRDMLRSKGIQVENDICVLCNFVRESSDHIFIHCSYSFDLWDYFIKSFKISWLLPRNFLGLFDAW